MFNSLIAMPADPILGLLTQYREDTHPQKVDLGVGVYKDPTGVTPILSCVKKPRNSVSIPKPLKCISVQPARHNSTP
ncbi:hypothetical protein LFREDSHE_26350 [Shewanella baltica]